MAGGKKRKGETAGAVPMHLKYPKYDMAAVAIADAAGNHMAPSQLIAELSAGPKPRLKNAPPRIIEFLNMENNTAQVNTIVDIDEPLFQPYPSMLCFDDYEPFGTYEKTLYMRNNDNVARRVKLLPPDSEYFVVSAPKSAQSSLPLKDAKVAAGMEICFTVTFKPQEKREYNLDLVCSTEREKFVIPIRAMGLYAVLNFPDFVDFGVCPVKKTYTKTMVVRNMGTKASKFLLSASGPFSVEKVDLFVDVGGSGQVELNFLPNEAMQYQGELMVEDESGRQCFVALSGIAENVNVYLGQTSVEPDPAYISLSSQKTVKIYNRSEYPVKFQWKAFSNNMEEMDERARLHEELARMELLERQSIDEQQFPDDASDASLSDDGEGICSEKRQELAALVRKYKNLRKAVQEDEMYFADENFQIEPQVGEIWANSEIEITVTFRPQTAAEYDCAAFLDVTGRDSRLQLHLTGKGIGPKATLSYDVLDIGDVFVNSVHRYEITMENRGDIESGYQLLPSLTPFGPKFAFSPDRGTLAVGESHNIEVTFCSEILGEFSEHFNFKLHGSDEPLSVHFKGHVVGPTFHFDVEDIDFGKISYDFLNSRTICLMNTSEIPMKFALRVPQDGNYLNKEFQLIPANGTVLPGGKQQITVDFISTNVKRYDYYLTVDVEGVGEGLLSIPITAVCEVPSVKLLNDEVKYGMCFMRYPYQQTMTLVNESDLQAKYEVVAQDEHSQAVASYEADAFRGAIPAFSQHEITLTMVCEKLGNIRLPVHVRIAGSSEPPLMATLSAKGVGPNVKLSKEKIDFGPSKCLVEHHRNLTITNDSLIPAPFKVFIKSSRSKFSVSPKEGVLAPHESLKLQITALLDDTVLHNDILHLIVTEGQNLVVPVSAKGTETTMYCDDDLSSVDFGYQLTNKVCEWKTTLENKGRRTQVLTWVNKTLLTRFAEAKRKEKEEEANSKNKRNNKKKVEKPPIEPVFTVVPETIELRPRTACTFTFRGFWKMRASVSEQLVCETKVGQEKNARIAFNTEIKADFINPLLEPSMPQMKFNYTYDPDVELVPQSQPLTLKNVSELPLTFVLRTAVPYSLDVWECSLAPQESITVNVGFDPGYRNDRQTHNVVGKITCVYRDHPQKDTIEILGEINFPNLDFEFTLIDFGCILNDTTKSVVVKVKNCSKVHTAFQWAFCEDEDEMRLAATAKRPYIPVNQVFDILPIRGYLAPDQVEEVEFIYYGHAGRKFKGMVLCEVEGGPEYELNLQGEASNVSYRLDKDFIHFGQQLHSKQEEREFCIINTGKVSVPFNIRLDKVSRPGVIEVHPASGRVFGGEGGENTKTNANKQRIVVRFRPGIPDRLTEFLVVEVGHFAPIEFPVYGHGIFASLSVSLPRTELIAIEVEPALGELPREANPNVSFFELKDEAQYLMEQPPEPWGPIEDDTGGTLLTGGASRPATRGSATAESDTLVPPGTAGSAATKRTARPSSPAHTVASGYTNAYQLNPAQMAIETEADRLYYMRYLLMEEAAAALPPKPIDEQEEEEEEEGEIVVIDGRPVKIKPLPKFILARNSCDFGHIVAGAHKQKKFKLTNTGPLPISFGIDKKLSLARGFTIEPERVVRLPEGESVEFTILFQATKNLPLGVSQVDMPILQKNGPPVNIKLRANVTVPEVAISSAEMDFGRIIVGQSRVIYTQIHNTSPVVADWGFKKPMGSAKDVPYFTMTPNSGILGPGEKVNVAVEFIPKEGRLHSLRLPIKVMDNDKSAQVIFRGEGTELKVAFDRPVQLGPILPHEEGSGLQVQEVCMTNTSDVAVEVYSLDFDEIYPAEEAILAECEGYDAEDTMRSTIRNAGEPLPDKIMKQHQRRLEAQAAAEAAAAAAAAEAEGGEGVGEIERAAPLPEPEEERAPTNRDQGLALDAIVHGPPLSGKTTQANLLANRRPDRWQIRVLTLDATVEAALELQGDLGFQVRQALKQLSEEEIAAIEEADGHKKGKGKKPASPRPDDEEPVYLEAELLADVLRWRLSQEDCGEGAILDGLECKFAASTVVSANAAAAAMGENQNRPSQCVFLSPTNESYAQMLQGVTAQAESILTPPPVEEEDVIDLDVDAGVTDLDAEPAVEEAFAEKTEEELQELDEEQRGDYFAAKAIEDEKNAEKAKWESVKARSEELYQQLVDLGLVSVEELEEGVEPKAEEPKAAEELAEGEQEAVKETAYMATLEDTKKAFFPAPPVEEVAEEGEEGAEAGEPAAEEAVEAPPEAEKAPSEAAAASSSAGTPREAGEQPEEEAELSPVVEVPVDAGEDPLQVHETLMTLVIEDEPEPDPDFLAIPPPESHFLQRRPIPRPTRTPVTKFQILEEAEGGSSDDEEAEDEKAKKGKKGKEEEAEVDEGPPEPKSVRWVIQPGEQVHFKVQYNSTQVGRFDSALGFEIVGGSREYTLLCSGMCAVPTINADPRNVFMNRIKGRPERVLVQKKYIMNKQLFEFGPLLINKDPKLRLTDGQIQQLTDGKSEADVAAMAIPDHEARASAAKTNSEVFRISNAGRTDAHVDFSFEVCGAAEADAKSDPLLDTSTVYYVDPPSIDLRVDETASVTVWAFPTQATTIGAPLMDSLVCSIEDNPHPVRFPMSCLGAKPELELHGPWEDEKLRSRMEADSMADDDEGKAAAVAKADQWENAGSLIDFDRLLLQRSEDKDVTIMNPSTIPVAWRLNLEQFEGCSEFDVGPTSGHLLPEQDTTITVNFSATEPKEFSPELIIEYSDFEGGLEANSERQPIESVSAAIKAEAYEIKTINIFGAGGEEGEGNEVLYFGSDADPNGGTGYGTSLRVGEKCLRQFSVKNLGKYRIRYQFQFKRAHTGELFTIEPMEAEIEPGADQQLDVTFCADHEIEWRPNKEIRCVIMEAETGEEEDAFFVSATTNTHFSKFRVQPQHGLNFAAIKFNDERKTKTFELRNDGKYEFAFKINDEKAEDNVPLEMTCADAEGGVGELVLPDVPDAASVYGQFTCTPGGGKILPGETRTIEVSFEPSASQVYRENLQIDITGRDYNDAASNAALAYELVGESCYPGINTTNFDDIFEEQSVIPKTDGSEGQQVALFIEEEKRFTFGAIVPSSHPKGMPEKFKISNPNKVSCVVNFAVEGAEGVPEETFTVQPAQWAIPPHEHRYVTVYFKPDGMRVFNATFTASVEDGEDEATKKLEFEISGEGTMPCLSLVQPDTAPTEDGKTLLDFGRLQCNKSKTLPIVLRNDGIVPATALFDMENNPVFSFSGRSGSVQVMPGTSESLEVGFHPRQANQENCNLKISVLHNQFEERIIQFSGLAFFEMLSFEDLPEDKEDELVFQDLDIDGDATSKEVTFSLKSHSTTPMRFAFDEHENITFSPREGHIVPKGSKNILATFTSAETVAFQNQPVNVTYNKIRQFADKGKKEECAPVDWDCEMKTVAYLTDKEFNKKYPKGVDKATGEKASRQVKTTVAQPFWTDAKNQEGEVEEEKIVPLKCTAVADTVKFECETKTIGFKTTPMFQTRVFTFPIVNTGKAKLDYSWAFEAMGDSRPSTAKSAQPVPCPYQISPQQGSVPAGATETFSVRFNPLEVEDFIYKLVCKMPGLAADGTPLVCLVRGQSERPVCHFELESSTYLQRRPADMVGPNGTLGALTPDVHVVEMVSLGTRVRNTKRFHVINPQNASYDFTFEPEGAPNPAFRCVSSGGIMLSGKRSEMVFEFTPDTIQTSEAFYRFKIPSHGVNELFLFVGTVLEPKVSLNRSRVDFSALLLGGHATETVHLTNNEHIPFNFSFDRTSYDFPGGAAQKPQIEINPVSGVVPPNGKSVITINFSPTEEKAHNFNLICNVKRKPTNLSLNIKGEGYAIHDLMEIEEENQDTGGTQLVALSRRRGDTNYVDFGSMQVNEVVTKKLFITNSGKFNYDFKWAPTRNPMIYIKPDQGTVPKGGKIECALTFHPKTELSFDAHEISCLVAGDRNYNLSLSASASQPALQFSFLETDFGPCFINAPGTQVQVHEAILRITNQELENDVSLDCLLEKSNSLDVKCSPTVLPPEHTIEVPILFMPREVKNYTMAIPFLLNGTSNINVLVKGEGVIPKIELVSVAQQNVGFGTLQIGQEATRSIKLINRSKCAASFELIDPELAGRGRLDECAIKFFPTGETTLNPGERCSIELQFAPFQRLAAFAEDLLINVAGSTRKLCTLSGCASGMSVELETDTLPFGSVCAKSQLTRHLNMQNSGDLVTKFQWDAKQFGPDFSISPVEGFLAPFSQLKFEVTFHPRKIDDDIRYEGLTCYLQGADPLRLTLTGACMEQPESSQNSLSFEAKARQEQTQNIEISNPTDKPWSLIPALDNSEHYRLENETVIIAAKGKGTLGVTYHPHSMTAVAGDDESMLSTGYRPPDAHTANIFVALPDGNALLYQLTGKAGEPELAGTLEKETPAKKGMSIPLPVENWMKVPQRFSVQIEREGEEDKSVFLDGAETIVVPPLHTRDFNLKFYSYKEGVTTCKVTFTNEMTKEYISYQLQITALEPGVIENLKMEAPVRQCASKIITIQNPLPANEPVTFAEGDAWYTCDNESVRVRKISELSGESEGTFEVQYRPLVPASEDANLVISCAELGDYKYALKLVATSAGKEISLNFKAPIGGTHVQMFKFKTFCKTETTFDCSVLNPVFFEVEPQIKAAASADWEGTEVVVKVVFEPEALGEVKDTLTIKSDTGGEYTCVLQGQCTPALPQGPFKMAKGGGTDVEFKNVFNEPKEFVFSVDNPAFACSAKAQTIASKAPLKVNIKFAGTEGGGVVAAKMLVSCPSMKNCPPWVYYLQGEG
jgi:hypothetical protein